MSSHNKTVLITGASSGIGKATALLLDKAGFQVFAGVRRDADGLALKDIASPRLRTLTLDVTNRDQIAAAILAVEDAGAPLHALVNNAGFNLNAAFEFTDEAKARELMDTNLFGLAILAQACLPHLRVAARASGETTKIVNIGSIGSLIGIPWEAWYHASKFAVLGLSESLHHEVYRQGVRVTVVCPGGIKTPFIRKSHEGAQAAIAAMTADGRVLYGQGVAALGELTGQVDRVGSTPERVAATIIKIVRQKNPPFRVLVGPDAVTMNAGRAFLPTSWFHAIVRRTFKC